MPPKKKAHHKTVRPGVVERINGCIQFDKDDPDLICDEPKRCKSETKHPIVHWFRSGHCSHHMDMQTHQHCVAILRSNAGGAKPTVCMCECHQGGITDWGPDTDPDLKPAKPSKKAAKKKADAPVKKTGPKKRVKA
jgi:hypothetical protein